MEHHRHIGDHADLPAFLDAFTTSGCGCCATVGAVRISNRMERIVIPANTFANLDIMPPLQLASSTELMNTPSYHNLLLNLSGGPFTSIPSVTPFSIEK
jgi:hypothetical protein